MRGLEERLRLALEGTETGFWEWHVATDTIEWSDNMGPLYGLPRGTQPAGVDDFLERIVHPEDRAALARADRGRGRATAPPTSSTCASRCPTAASAGCTPARARSPARTAAPSAITGLLSDVTERRHREEAHAFLDAASQVLAASMDPVQTLEEVAQLAVPRLADWCAVQLAPDVRHVRAGRRRPRRPREGALGARAAGPLPARPGRPDRRARRDPHRPLRALPGDRPGAARGRGARRGAGRGSCASCR